MPLLGGDSNSYWRFDLKAILKGFAILVILRGITVLLGIFPQYIPVIDDIVNLILAVMRWASITFNQVASQYFSF